MIFSISIVSYFNQFRYISYNLLQWKALRLSATGKTQKVGNLYSYNDHHWIISQCISLFFFVFGYINCYSLDTVLYSSFFFSIYFICFITSIFIFPLDLSKGDGIDTNKLIFFPSLLKGATWLYGFICFFVLMVKK